MIGKRIILLIALLGFLIYQVDAQDDKFDKAHKKKYEEAIYYFQYDNYHLAFPPFLELFYYDSLNLEVNFKLGVCYFFTVRDVSGARQYFERAKKEYIDSYYYLGHIYHMLGKFDNAIEAFQYYKNQSVEKTYDSEIVEHHMSKSITAKQLIAVKEDVQIKNMGKPINSPYPDYVPVISSDESKMLFTSRRAGSTGDKKDPNGEYFEDIYISYNKLGVWSDPEKLPAPVNSESHDACISLTPDGQKLFMYRTNRELTGGDIYTSALVDGKWTEPEIIKAAINSRSGLETSVCLSPDENELYFSSNRPGGYGGLDLYKVKILPNGEWSLASNLGPAINSPYDEDAPFLHPDGKTLYFSSKGHKNMGRFDIFRSDMMVDGKWSAPENVGYPINTVRDDIYFVVSADGKRGYLSSNRVGGEGNSDIYVVSMPNVMENRVLLKGTVTTNEPVFASVAAIITIIDYDTKELQGIYRTNKTTGKYLMVLFPDKKYKMIVEAQGYHNFIDEIDLTKRTSMLQLNKHVNLEPIVNTKIDPIQIELDSIAKVKADSLMKLNPDSLKIND